MVCTARDVARCEVIVYVASPLAFAFKAREWAEILRDSGMHVSSRWHDVVLEGAVDPLDADTRRLVLTDNLQDLRKARCVLALMSHGTPRATIGEIAYALAFGIPVVWLAGPTGQNDNIFSSHLLVTYTRSGSNALSALLTMARGER